MTNHVTRSSTLAFCRFSRPAITLAILIVLAAISLAIRCWRISSLPQIDEPFDIEAFCSATIPDDENAFTEYQDAFKLLVGFPGKCEFCRVY